MQASGRGTLVVSSLHCPAASWSVYFSHMLLLTADGRMAYQGPYGKVREEGVGHSRQRYTSGVGMCLRREQVMLVRRRWYDGRMAYQGPHRKLGVATTNI